MFEDVDGMEVFVNPEQVIWVREYPGEITIISCGDEGQVCGTPQSRSNRCRLGQDSSLNNRIVSFDGTLLLHLSMVARTVIDHRHR